MAENENQNEENQENGGGEEEDSANGAAEYKEFSPDASPDDYEAGEILHFEQVRNWLDQGKLVEAYGKVVDIEEYDDGTPFLKVSFAEASDLNDVSLGNEIRQFILEQ